MTYCVTNLKTDTKGVKNSHPCPTIQKKEGELHNQQTAKAKTLNRLK